MICKNCGSEVELTRAELAREMGRATSAKKAESSRRNGRLGGRKRTYVSDAENGWHKGPNGDWYGSIDQKPSN